MTQIIPIVMYHSVTDYHHPRYEPWALTPEFFGRQMAYLEDTGYHPLTVTDLVGAMTGERDWLPERPIALTFDDGLSDFVTGALPFLARYGFAATLYVITGLVGKRTTWLAREGAPERPLLDWSEIVEISASGIECGSHAHLHRRLDTLPRAEAQNEISSSKRILEQHLEKSVKAFSYPYGHFSRGVRRLVQEAGYLSACATLQAVNSPRSDRFALARVLVRPDTSMAEFDELLRGHAMSRFPRARFAARRVRSRWSAKLRDASEAGRENP